MERIRVGVRDCFLGTSALNVLMMAAVILLRGYITPLFVDEPTPEITAYASGYILAVAPFYLLLGLLSVYRSSIQSMNNAAAPFAACIIELAARLAATAILSRTTGYIGICLATPLAWVGANALLVPVYLHMTRKK